ncbi:MAG: peroxiredoxin [Gammaproteobacteria bacterium]
MNLPTGNYSATDQQSINFAHYKGHWLILYFYPKDATPGCTREGQDFRDAYADFTALKAEIIGISRDTVACHDRFKQKQGFPFPLLSDTDEKLCQHFDVIKDKILYGKQHRGIERSTFLIDPNGVIRHEWRKVKVEGHVKEVYEKLVSMLK